LFAVLDRSAAGADPAAGSPAAAPRPIGFGRAALHLGGLWALAFAWPLLDLLGGNAQFFVARGSTRGDILLLAFGYTLVPPLLGALIVWALGRARPSAGWAAMLALVAVCVAGLVLPPLGDLLGGSALAVPAALAVGAAAAAVYARVAAVRSFAGVLSPAPLIVLFLFLVVSPVHELVLPGDAAGSIAGPASSSTPIVLIVLDELPESTVAHGPGGIDAGLFPNLARFAGGATWYRNATTVADQTTDAVPAQLTGELPRAGILPTARDHPRSLFTLFGRSHDLTVVEPITDVCPDRLCADVRPGTGERLRSLESDLEVVVKRILLPADMRKGLPPIDRVWEGFDAAAKPQPEKELHGGSLLIRDVLSRLATDDATAGFKRAISALDQRGSRPPLLFVHSTLPHGAWRYLPDGRIYPIDGFEYPGLDDHAWRGPQWLVDQSFARHVLQTQYVDRLIGALLRKLRATGRYDDAVIVIAADHGASFSTGEPRRGTTAGNIGEIAPVPLLVKYPGQRDARIEDGAVRTIDVLPTIADAAGVRVPWDADGEPARERAVDPGAAIAIAHEGETVLERPLRDVLAQRDARAAADARLLRDGPYALGPRPDLIGRRFAAGAGEPVRSAFVNGRIDGAAPGTELAVVVDGVVRATTWAYRTRDGEHVVFSALVPPGSLRAGSRVALARIVSGTDLRPLPR
jgi:hypothetical protein